MYLDHLPSHRPISPSPTFSFLRIVSNSTVRPGAWVSTPSQSCVDYQRVSAAKVLRNPLRRRRYRYCRCCWPETLDVHPTTIRELLHARHRMIGQMRRSVNKARCRANRGLCVIRCSSCKQYLGGAGSCGCTQIVRGRGKSTRKVHFGLSAVC